MRFSKTPCCALIFLSVKDYENIHEIHKKLLKYKKKLNQTEVFYYGAGQTTVQAIIEPFEIKNGLANKLKKLGFKSVTKFQRRLVSCDIQPEKAKKEDQLTLMVLKLTDLKDKI